MEPKSRCASKWYKLCGGGDEWLTVKAIGSVREDQGQDVKVQQTHIPVFPPLHSWKDFVGKVKVPLWRLVMPALGNNHCIYKIRTCGRNTQS
jgi:hypothetical protein